jgi:hypothetical protein
VCGGDRTLLIVGAERVIDKGQSHNSSGCGSVLLMCGETLSAMRGTVGTVKWKYENEYEYTYQCRFVRRLFVCVVLPANVMVIAVTVFSGVATFEVTSLFSPSTHQVWSPQ